MGIYPAQKKSQFRSWLYIRSFMAVNYKSLTQFHCRFGQNCYKLHILQGAKVCRMRAPTRWRKKGGGGQRGQSKSCRSSTKLLLIAIKLQRRDAAD